MLTHGANIEAKETHQTKYQDAESRQFISEIRIEYDKWSAKNESLKGPRIAPNDGDEETIRQRVVLLSSYKDFIDQQKYAKKFDSRSNLHSTVLEEFLFYLFGDLAQDFGERSLIGKAHTFKDIFFIPPTFASMLEAPHAHIETKDHDFVIGTRVNADLRCEFPSSPESDDSSSRTESHSFDIPAIAIECKTYLDKTMLEGASTAAQELKARNPNALFLVVSEWLKLSEDVNLFKYKVDQIYVLRKQKNTDREYRFLPSYIKKPIDPCVVWHLYETVRNYLRADWDVERSLERGWLIG